MYLHVQYIQQVDEMADNLIDVMLESENIKHGLFIKAANLVDRWRGSTIELIFMMESATCIELDILLEKYEAHLNETLFYANNYDRD